MNEHEREWQARVGRILAFVSVYRPGVYLLDIEEAAYGRLSYADFCQLHEWACEFDTCADLLDQWPEWRAWAPPPAERE